MNDEMHDFDPRPGRINSVEPGKRPLSSMAPTIVLKDGKPLMALGSAGGPKIITSALQVILNVLDFGMPLTKAVACPRFHCQESTILLEGGVPEHTEAGLKKLGHPVERRPHLDLFFGGIHAIHVVPKGIVGMADPRRDGIALGV
jgi:gamma-glutamyltranspeptidase/glutathione hydrolase